VYHLKCNPTVITYYRTKKKSGGGLPPPLRHSVKVTLVPRPLLTPVAQKLYKCEHSVITNVCSLSKITSHRNRFLLLVKHLATRILTRNYRTRQLYPDWQKISRHCQCLNRKHVRRRTALEGETLRSVEETVVRSQPKSLRKLSEQLNYCFTAGVPLWAHCWAWPLGAVISRPYPPDYFLWGFLKESIYSNNPWGLKELKHDTEHCYQRWPRNTTQSRTKHTEMCGCLSSRRWWTFSASAAKLFCKFS
jgi:hypothetical protein